MDILLGARRLRGFAFIELRYPSSSSVSEAHRVDHALRHVVSFM